MEGCFCCGISFLQSVFILFVNPLLELEAKEVRQSFNLAVPKLTECWLPLNVCVEFRGNGPAGGSTLLRISPGAPCVLQDHKRNLISDVEKQQALLRFILKSRVRELHGWKQVALFSRLAGESDLEGVSVPFWHLAEFWMGKERKQRVRAERWLIC